MSAEPFPTSPELRRILAAPRLSLGQWPTPLERVEFRGQPILVKRDDLSGFGRGGAKTRKIEHVLGLMRARGHDELITVVGNITNLGFDLLPALRVHGFSWRIFVQDDPPLPDPLRRHLFAGIASDLSLLGSSRGASFARVVGVWLRRRAAGRRPFLLLPGASHPAGVIGNAWGFIEMVQQCWAAGTPLPEKVFVSLATGTTLAGFLLAENALRHCGFDPIRIIGVQVYPGDVARRTRLLVRWTERHLGLGHAVDPSRIEVRTEALAGGFGRTTKAVEQLCRDVASDTGLRIDPIFGGKTWAIMAAEGESTGEDERPVMFWHCGDTPEWPALVRAVAPGHHPETQPVPAAMAVAPGMLAAEPPPVHVTLVDEEFRAAPAPSTARKLATIAAYALTFYGALPAFLWSFGGKIDTAFALPEMPQPTSGLLGAALLALGASIILASTWSLFRIGRGLPISHLPPTRFVNLGCYRWVRHPHYVGYNLAFVGCGLLAGSWGRALGAGMLLLGCWLLYALVFEEPRLLRRFGASYASYRTCVRVLPLLSPGGVFQQLVLRLNRPLEALANHVELARTGPVVWVTYGLLAALGAAAMALGFAAFLQDRGWTATETNGAVALVSIAIALVSRVAWFVLPGDKPRGPLRQLMRRVGFVSWGGYAAAFGSAFVLGAWAGVPPGRMADAVMLTGLVASGVSRWGCLTYGCCIGQSAAWGLRWTHPQAWIHRLRPGCDGPRIPTQLLSSLHALVAGAVLLALSFRPSVPGALAAVGGILYALPRFGVEHLREEARFGPWQLTTGQFGSIVIFLSSVLLLHLAAQPPAPFWLGGALPWSFALLPAALIAFAIVFVAYGVHWKRVGQW